MKTIKENLAPYILFFAAGVMLLIGIFLIIREKNFTNNSYFEILETKMLEYGKEIFKEDDIWLTDERDEFLGYVSLEDCQTHYHKDISMFNDTRVRCDLKNTYVKFYVNPEGSKYEVVLSCAEK